MEKLFGHQREGFIWQKLREPRSYDYQEDRRTRATTSGCGCRKFTVLDDAKREAIITFVLGLVAEPPAAQYVYQADAAPQRDRRKGMQVIEKFNCTGCHTLEMDRWQLAYEPGDFARPGRRSADYPFLTPHFTPQQIKASLADRRPRPAARDGHRHAGGRRPGQAAAARRGRRAARSRRQDDQGVLLVRAVGQRADQRRSVGRPACRTCWFPSRRIEKRYPAVGGFLPRLAYPTVVTEEKKVNPNAKPDEAWGWLPPPLVGEGRKVQTAWLHDFLLDPHPIRPAVVLRMPKFNMSPADATKLVNYFAAVDGVDYPYDFDPRTRESYLAGRRRGASATGLSDALKIVTDNNFCVKCHLLGDFSPTGSERAKAPHLDEVYKRLRPDFTLALDRQSEAAAAVHGHAGQHPATTSRSASRSTRARANSSSTRVVDLLLNYDRFHGEQDLDQTADQAGRRRAPARSRRRGTSPGRGPVKRGEPCSSSTICCLCACRWPRGPLLAHRLRQTGGPAGRRSERRQSALDRLRHSSRSARTRRRVLPPPPPSSGTPPAEPRRQEIP